MEKYYSKFLGKKKVYYYSDLGISGSEEVFSSSNVSSTDFVGRFSLDIIVNERLVKINSVAIIAVDLLKKLPADRDDIKLSWDAPNPRAPPSDFWRRTDPISRIANIIFKIKTKFSISVIYSIFLLYQ
jgi:hypothetical protein